MRPLGSILRTDQWQDQPAFVVGSGPSLRNFDYRPLTNRNTIGCNEEYRWGPCIAICQDVRFFFGDGSPGRTPAKDNPAWYGGPQIPVWFKGHPDRPDPHVERDEVFAIGAATELQRNVVGALEFRWPLRLEDGLAYGAMCGIAALSLADALGASPIFLLGMDCKATPDGTTHSHDRYPADWKMTNAKHRAGVFAMWAKEYRKWAPHVRGRAVTVGDSAVDAFPRVGMEAFREALLAGESALGALAVEAWALFPNRTETLPIAAPAV